MRGKVSSSQGVHVNLGITPAYAGKSGGRPEVSILFEDHPRVCGEKEDRQRELGKIQGSPPRMRGKD